MRSWESGCNEKCADPASFWNHFVQLGVANSSITPYDAPNLSLWEGT
jgi:hypothetical protein